MHATSNTAPDKDGHDSISPFTFMFLPNRQLLSGMFARD